jgi:hemerythrin-like domain-containing protein
METIWTRREMIASSLLLAAPALGMTSPVDQLKNPELILPQGGISALEDLMREHGIMDRILLIYEEILRRISTKTLFDANILLSAARLAQTFIENYHEKLEEDYIFPQFETAGRFADLTKTLRDQHAAGRILTLKIIDMADSETMKEPKNMEDLVRCMRQFIRLYRPHKAREDTVLFPAIHSLLTDRQLATLGDTFEDKEHDLFGKDGFENVVEQVAALERNLDIYDLAQFTTSQK